jgi:hypothetical protein
MTHEDPVLVELRAAYTELRKPPWNRHSEKMARLYAAIDAVLGGPIFLGDREVPSQETICDEHKAQYFQSGYEAGKKDAIDDLDGGVGFPEGTIIGKNSESHDPALKCEHGYKTFVRDGKTMHTGTGGVCLSKTQPIAEARCDVHGQEPEGGVVHSHGMSSMHRHEAADYDNHQQPIDNERFLRDNVGPVGTEWPQAQPGAE